MYHEPEYAKYTHRDAERRRPLLWIGRRSDGCITLSPERPDRTIEARLDSLPGANRDGDTGIWYLPWSQNAISRLRSLFPDHYVKQKRNFRDWPPLPQELKDELRARKYSRKTIDAYLRYNRLLLEHAKKVPEDIEQSDIRRFLSHLSESQNVSTSYLNGAISALKFFYGTILHRDFAYDITRPRRDQMLPTVLSKEEVTQLIESAGNLKHRTMLMLVYSSGLRLSEVIRLKMSDIDLDRNTIHIKGGKGRKDRVTILSKVAKKALRVYVSVERPIAYIFPGRRPGKHISSRTAQHAFEQAKKRAGIKQRATIHTLRHSFATHLLESGIDIRYIQQLLGHRNTSTTEIYTHVSTRYIESIKSPLDTLDLDKEGE